MYGGSAPKQKEFEMKLNSYGSFPVTRPTHTSENDEENKGCLSSLYAKIVGRPVPDEQEEQGDEWQPQIDPSATWQERLTLWLRVDKWRREEKVVAACVLALLFFSSGERIFFKAAVDDMAPFRCSISRSSDCLCG